MKVCLILLLAVVFEIPYGFACPSEVVILRHGEKPPQGDHLDATGKQRASELVNYFKTPDLNSNGKPTKIYTFQPVNGKHLRGVETMMPTSAADGIPIDTSFKVNDTAALAKQILSDPYGKTEVVCWEHERIKAIASALGVSNPPSWHDQDFDHTYFIDFDKSCHVLDFRIEPQFFVK